MESKSDIEKGKSDEIDSIHVEWESTFANKKKKEWKSTFRVDQKKKSTFVENVLSSNSPVPESCCIFRVPEVLRRQKKVAYQPDIVSIGPFHRGGKKFQLVENVKKWYLKRLLLSRSDINLDSLIEKIKGMETVTRNCYAEPINLNQNNFVEMLILDGWFLIELFRKAVLSKNEQQDRDDPIFNMPCMLEYLYHDLLLLENQLPWFVLEFFYNLIKNTTNPPPLSQVVIDFFKNSVADPHIFNYHESDSSSRSQSILHILDLVRTALVSQDSTVQTTSNWLLRIPDLLRKWIQKKKADPSLNSKTAAGHLPQRIPSAVTLSEAGVQFKRGKAGCILNITFEKGVFTIPPLAIDERTSPLFRNLMAYEQCYHNRPHKITSYAVLMDNLIDTSKDVDLLCHEGIVANWLSAEDASKFFNELYNDTTVIAYDYEKLCKHVEEYHKALWNRWRETLWRDYFGTPWATISFVAAVILLLLTLSQTIYTILPYYHPGKN